MHQYWRITNREVLSIHRRASKHPVFISLSSFPLFCSLSLFFPSCLHRLLWHPYSCSSNAPLRSNPTSLLGEKSPPASQSLKFISPLTALLQGSRSPAFTPRSVFSAHDYNTGIRLGEKQCSSSCQSCHQTATHQTSFSFHQHQSVKKTAVKAGGILPQTASPSPAKMRLLCGSELLVDNLKPCQHPTYILFDWSSCQLHSQACSSYRQ